MHLGFRWGGRILHRHSAGTKSGSHPLRAWGEVQGALELKLSLVLKRLTRCGMIMEDKRGREGFPGGTVVENLPANAGDTGSSPGLGRSHMPRSN